MGKIHLYTIWNPILFNDTLQEHFKVLINQCLVKWLILYDCDITFKDMLDDYKVKRINNQAKRTETLLYIQCLNIFYKPLHVGKIKTIEKIKDTAIDENDSLIPKYYHRAIIDKKLDVYYSITLSDLKEITNSEIINLIPSEDFKSSKFNFPFPCLIRQKKLRTFFPCPAVEKIAEIEIVYEFHESLIKRRWLVKKPASTKETGPLTLGNEELNLIKLFKEKPRSPKSVKTIMKKLGKNKSNIQNMISRIRAKFKYHCGKKLIITERGKYKLQTDKIIIRPKS